MGHTARSKALTMLEAIRKPFHTVASRSGSLRAVMKRRAIIGRESVQHKMYMKTVFYQWQSISDNSNRKSFKRTLEAVPANSPAADPGSVRSDPYYSSRRLTHGARPHQR